MKIIETKQGYIPIKKSTKGSTIAVSKSLTRYTVRQAQACVNGRIHHPPT